MNFRLTAEQATFQCDVREFVTTGLPASWDDPALEMGGPVERDIMKRLASRRWLALPWPEAFGSTILSEVSPHDRGRNERSKRSAIATRGLGPPPNSGARWSPSFGSW